MDRTALPNKLENQHGNMYFTSSPQFSMPEQVSSRSLCSTSETSTVTSASSTSMFLSHAMSSLENFGLNDYRNKSLATNPLNELIKMQPYLHLSKNTQNIEIHPMQYKDTSSTDKHEVNYNYVTNNQNSESTDEEINKLIFETFVNPTTNEPIEIKTSHGDGTLSYDQSTDVTSTNMGSFSVPSTERLSNNAEPSSLADFNFVSEIDYLILETFLDTENKSMEQSVANESESAKKFSKKCCKDMKNGVKPMHRISILNPIDTQNMNVSPMKEIYTYSNRAA